MKKILAPLVALAFGLGAISAFAADAPAKEDNAATANKKPAPKKAKRASKKRSAAKSKKAQAPAADSASK